MTTTTRMATLNPALLRTISFLCARVHHRRLGLGLAVPSGRAWCSGASESTRPDSLSSSADSSALRRVLSVRDPPKYLRWDDPDYCKWKDKEREILNDIEPVVLMAKEILHSDRYCHCELSSQRRGAPSFCFVKMRRLWWKGCGQNWLRN